MLATDEIKLIEADKKHETGAIAANLEMISSCSEIHGSGQLTYASNYDEWLKNDEENKKIEFVDFEQDKVPSRTYFVVRSIDDKVVGFVNIRFSINREYAESWVGNIGYSIIPSERRKGYGEAALEKALAILKKSGAKKAVLSCREANIASSKTIEKNGGKLVGKNDKLFSSLLYEIKL